MIPDATLVNPIGTACFGAVIGWCIYYSLRRWDSYSPPQVGILITAVLGGAVTTFFAGPFNTGATGAYGIGLAIGFFSYVLFASIDKLINKDKGNEQNKPGELFRMEESTSKEQEDETGKHISASDFFKKNPQDGE